MEPSPVLLPGESHGQDSRKGARCVAVHGIAKSWTPLKHLSRQAGKVITMYYNSTIILQSVFSYFYFSFLIFQKCPMII